MKIGTRIIYESNSKNIATILHRMEGNVLERSDEPLMYVDIPYDSFHPTTHYISGIDEDGMAIIEKLPIHETEEQKQIRELEDVLLLQTENEVGGIL